MSLITTEYLKVDISQPDGQNNNLLNLIDRYELEILEQLFGYELAQLIINYNSGSEQRIKDIVEGKTYTVDYNGREQTIRWNGLINDQKISLISYYVAYWAYRNNSTQTANNGEVIPSQQHSNEADSRAKQASAWHQMRKLYGYCSQNELAPSAFNFMTKFSDDYPEWVFEKIGIMTMFGTF